MMKNYVLMVSGRDGNMMVAVLPGGTLEYGPGYTPDAAAKLFWEALADHLAQGVAPGLYRHYKGALYRVIGLVRDSTNGEGEGRTLVLYYSDAEHGFHVRELEQFAGVVEVDGLTVRRFTRVGP